MTLENEIKKLTDAVKANTAALSQITLTPQAGVTLPEAPTASENLAVPEAPAAPETPAVPEAPAAPETPAVPATPPPPPQTEQPNPVSPEQLQTLMQEKSVALADNGAACFKIITDLKVTGIAQMTDAQRIEAAQKVAELQVAS